MKSRRENAVKFVTAKRPKGGEMGDPDTAPSPGKSKPTKTVGPWSVYGVDKRLLLSEWWGTLGEGVLLRRARAT